MSTNTFITVGSRDDLKLLLWCARTGNPVNWTVPMDAKVSEKIYFVVPSRSGPVRAFGFVDDAPQPSSDFGGKYRATVANIEMLEVPVSMDEIAKRFKTWPYWGNAKSYHEIPKEYAREFEQFIEEYQTAPQWKILDVLEHADEIWEELGNEVEESQAIADADVFADLEDEESDDEDEERIAVSIKRRRGQSTFRNRLRQAYNNTCAITKCNCHHSLEAAHISPYRNVASNDVTNGLLLRADIHTLFDLNLIAIDEEGYIRLSNLLLRTPLGDTTSYAYLNGQQAKLPQREEQRPSKEALRERLKQLRS